MKHTNMIEALCALAVGFALRTNVALAGKGNADNPGILPPDSHAYGKTYGEWSAAWWQWAYSLPATDHPLYDQTGSAASFGQSGSVWFLGGSYLSVAEGNRSIARVTRQVDIPANTALFFPLINTEANNFSAPPAAPSELSARELREMAKWTLDHAWGLACTIDGKPVSRLSDPLNTPYRVQSPLFQYVLPAEDNLYKSWGLDIFGPVPAPGAVADGVFLMLAPLALGSHTIHFSGNNDIPDWNSFFTLEVTYQINVVDVTPAWPIDSKPYGKTYAEWADAWWQWVFSFPADVNPMLDPTGEQASNGQSGPVWFLAGTQGGNTTRTVTVPSGKALFFPVYNAVWVNLPPFGDDPWSAEQDVFARDYLVTTYAMDSLRPNDLQCEIDGKSVKNLLSYRCPTAPGQTFMISLPENDFWGLVGLPTLDGGVFQPGTYGPSVQDGFYLMLPPLSPGSHTIHFSKREFLDVTYNLTVLE